MKKILFFILIFLSFLSFQNKIKAQGSSRYCKCVASGGSATCMLASNCNMDGRYCEGGKMYDNASCTSDTPDTPDTPGTGGDSKSNWKAPCVGADGTLSSDVATLQGIQCLITNILGHIMSFLGIIGFCMFIYGSVMLMLSRGQPNALETAKDTLTFAVLGIILALSAFIIVNLLSYFTGIDSLMTIEFIQDNSD